MRVLLLMRGAMGCGKSTFIEQHGLKPYTLCADDIRLLCQSPVLDTNGKQKISQKNEKVVWKTLFDILETRMKRGEFTVIDATNTKTSEMNRYKELANKYRYRIYCVDMTDVPIEVAKERNAKRDPVKFVPEEAIDRAYARFANQKIPSGIKAIKPHELDTIWYRAMDLSSYDKVHVIGDIHGCYTALMDVMNDPTMDINGNEYFIFLGDYLDRGLENAQVLEYLMKLWETHDNVYFLEGNHEAHLRAWAHNEDIGSPEFRNNTAPKLEMAGIDKKMARQFCRALGQCSFINYNGNYILVTHGGLSNVPANLTFVATEQMIKGVGDYKDAHDVDVSFYKNTNSRYYSVHGHRNETNEPLEVTPATFNLNGDVEFGGYLRTVTFVKNEESLDKMDVASLEIKNTVYKIPEDVTKTNNEIANAEIKDVVEYMRASKYVRERKFGNISSFNFTRDAFEGRAWDGITTKARGLYIDTKHNEIVARGYDKFFNLGEMDCTQPEALGRNLVFPVTVYVKENGYLGLVSTDHDGDLIFASKSTLGGDHALWLKENLYEIYGEDTLEKLRKLSKELNATFVFEVIDTKRDPHIIKYYKNECILLDIIYNDINFHKMEYDDMLNICKELGIKGKKYATKLWDIMSLDKCVKRFTDPKYRYVTDDINDDCVEGFVFEDANGFMFKLKVNYYNEWKMLRTVAGKVFRSGNINFTGALQSVESNYFYGWCRRKFDELERNERREYMNKDVISLRDEFRADMEKNNVECEASV